MILNSLNAISASSNKASLSLEALAGVGCAVLEHMRHPCKLVPLTSLSHPELKVSMDRLGTCGMTSPMQDSQVPNVWILTSVVLCLPIDGWSSLSLGPTSDL